MHAYVRMYICMYVYIMYFYLDYQVFLNECIFLFKICIVSNTCPNGCYNGGTCISAGVCRCTNEWSGGSCTTRMYLLLTFIT